MVVTGYINNLNYSVSIKALEICYVMRYVNLRFAYLLT